MATLKEMKFLDSFKGKSLWSVFPPLFLTAYLLFSMVSISLSQLFLTLSFVFWIVMLIRDRQRFVFPSFFWPILAYVALSMVSVFFSVDMQASLKDSRELLLFLIVPIVYISFRKEKAIDNANFALLASAGLAFLYSLYQLFFKFSWPKERITGFMNNAMTQGGLLLLFCCLAFSIFIFSKAKIKYLWGAGFLVSLFALILTQTRSAWIGLIIAACLILLLYKPKLLIIVPVLLALFYFLSPQSIKNRAQSIFSLEDKSNQYRIEYLKAGFEIIKDYPLFGTGPDTVDKVFQDPKYGLSKRAKMNVHLHNNIIQTAAERGIPTLLSWLAIMAWIFFSFLKLLKNKNPTLRPLAAAGLAALLALFTAGLFEYNFADSEITALFLYMITVPFALNRIQEKSSEN